MKILLPLFGSLAVAGLVFTPTVLAENGSEPGSAQQKPMESSQMIPAFLGVAVAESMAPAGVVDHIPVAGSVVLTVTSVHPDSPAERAGLRVGDSLLKIDDQLLLHPVQLHRLVSGMSADHQAELTIFRDGKTETLMATLSSRPAELAMAVPGRLPAAGLEFPGWPEGFEPMLRIEQWPGGAGLEDMLQMQELMQQRFDRLFQAPEFAEPGVELPEGWRDRFKMELDGNGFQSQTVQDDGEHRLTVTTDAQGRHLKAVDEDGTVLFDGPINTADQLEAVPEEVREKLPAVDPQPSIGRPSRLAV